MYSCVFVLDKIQKIFPYSLECNCSCFLSILHKRPIICILVRVQLLFCRVCTIDLQLLHCHVMIQIRWLDYSTEIKIDFSVDLIFVKLIMRNLLCTLNFRYIFHISIIYVYWKKALHSIYKTKKEFFNWIEIRERLNHRVDQWLQSLLHAKGIKVSFTPRL